jgi:hypothetical protein
MEKIYFLLSIIVALTIAIHASDADWQSDSWGVESLSNESNNDIFEKIKIKSRSKKEYDDKIYKYITGDYHASNNRIQLSTVHLNDSLMNDDVELNVHIEDLEIEGNDFRDSIDIKHNPYKNFVQNNQNVNFFEDTQQLNSSQSDLEITQQVASTEYDEVIDTDTSKIEEINIEDKKKIKEINIFIEDTNIIVD